eukprot:symbB.v1.2.034292.t2/scaffold4401.1/size40130/2
MEIWRHAEQEAGFWILGDPFLRQVVVAHDLRGNVTVFPRQVNLEENLAARASTQFEAPRDKGSAILHIPCDGPGLRVLFYGDSLTAGAPSMCSYAEEFCKCLTATGCYIEGTVCGLCAASAYEMLEIAQEPFVLDSLQSRWGSGIAHLASQADLVVIMAGTNDLAFADGKHIFKSFTWLAHGLPSLRRSHCTNTAVEGTNLTPELFVNSVALMPFGPQSRNAGYWETDGVHFTAAGAKVLGYRLAEVLRPLILRFQADCMVAKTSELAAVGEIPSLNAFLEAFDLEDEEQIDNAQHAQQAHRDHRDWELPAVRTLQIYARDNLYRLAKEKDEKTQRAMPFSTSWIPMCCPVLVLFAAVCWKLQRRTVDSQLLGGERMAEQALLSES